MNWKIYRHIILAIFAVLNVEGVASDNVVPAEDVLPEVTVTAMKQMRKNIENGDVAATVLSDSLIEWYNISAVKEISSIAPNFYQPDYGTRMTSSIYVRGLGARIDQPVVGLNVDNVPMLNKDSYDFEIMDIERVEMLRGAQSTLYGRNTMGGLINIYTLSPMKFQGVRFLGEYGNGNSLKLGLSYYCKPKESLGMSLSGYFTMTDGFFSNINNGKEVGTERQGSIRWKTIWKPSRRLTVENIAVAQLTRQGGYPYASVSTEEINYNDTCFYKRTGVTDGLTLRWIGDKFTLSSVTSFQYINDNMTLDQDFLPLSYFTLTQKRHEWALSQDFVVSGVENDYSWLCGLFGFYKRTNMSAPVTFKDYGIEQLIEKHRNEANPCYPIGWNENTFVLGSDFRTPTYGVAFYHQSSYRKDDFTITAGLRIDYEQAKLSYHSHCNTSYTVYDFSDGNTMRPYENVPVVIDDYGALRKSFLEVLPKLTVSYRLPLKSESSVYASIAKGYKAGGFNTQMFSDVLQQRIMGMMGIGMKYDINDVVGYAPEKCWTYEIGTHLRSDNNKLSADITAFYIDCRNQQLTVFPDGTTTGRIMTNAGKTRSFGAEVSLSFEPTDRLYLRASYGYTNARFVEFDNGKADYSGKQIPYAPSNTLFASAGYRFPLNLDWLEVITFNVNLNGVGNIYWDEANEVKQPFYALLGGAIRFENKRYSLDVWGENLTSTDYDTFYFVSIGNAFVQRGKPCRYGVTLRFNFVAD